MRQMLSLAIVMTATLWLMGCDLNAEDNHTLAAGVPVDVIKLETQSQIITVELPGRTRAYLEAEVRPQVSGIIQARSFTEGGEVTQGESLYQIDPDMYQAALISAKAELERAKASKASSMATALRFKELLKTKAVSQQDFDQAQAAYLEAKASVAIAKAAINTAKINLQYTKVQAPISGRIGLSNITPGALVNAGQSQALATISQLDPINIDIVQSSAQMLRLKQQVASGRLQQMDNTNVSLILEDGSLYPYLGKLQFTEVTVNQDTGVVKLRAEFPNPDAVLLPGMFVKTQVNMGIDPNAILVPQHAISRNPKGQGIAMVVNADNQAELRIVQTSEVINNHWLITEGLKAGEQVIVAGLQKIRPRTPVIPKLINDSQLQAQAK